MTFAIVTAFLLMCIFYLLYQRIKRRPGTSKGLQIAVKCAATAMAAVVALTGCLQNTTVAHWVLLAGLVACTAADGILCVHFMAGGAVFALGHVLYITAFCLMRRPDQYSAILFLCLAGLAAACFIRFRHRIGHRFPFVCAYAAVLITMLALASAQAPLYFAGALLFTFSDALLGWLLISGSRQLWLDYLSLGAYYLGQFLLGLAAVAS